MAMSDGGGRSRMPLLALGLLAVAVAGFLVFHSVGAEALRATMEAAWARLEQAPPLVFFSAMVLICLFPVPITLFYVSAGPLFGVVPALLWILPTLAVNQLLGHALATGILRPPIERLIESHGYTVPNVTAKSDQALLTAVVRITPGFPYFLQNLVLGIAGVERTRYLVISIPIQMIYATGFVVLGRSAFEGDMGVAVIALALIVALSVGARLVHNRLRARGRHDGALDTTGHSADE